MKWNEISKKNGEQGELVKPNKLNLVNQQS